MSELMVVPAGAGAGKTHHIKQMLGDWVRDGTVRPERILAVTFTEAAAGELRQRIRSALLDSGDIDAALAVERAYVSTIHALGQRVLLEHAFAAGSSPQMRLSEEGEQQLLIRRCIEEEPALRAMAGDLAAHGYRASFGSDRSAEDVFRGAVLKLVNLLRSVGARGADPALADQAETSIRAHYGPVKGTDDAAIAALRHAVDALLQAFPQALSDPSFGPTAAESFRKDFAWLMKARHMLRGTGRDWRLWQSLRKLRQSVRGCPTPAGYDDLAQGVMAAAAALDPLPGPLEDAVAHARALIAGAQEVMAGYAKRKRALGVIDYTDMVANAAHLLANHPAALDAILAEVDCVVIDEFQDASPIQFSFLWHLARRSRRTLIVGDTKQAIMGFQGADPRLAAALAVAHPHPPLAQNWRSDPRIMALVNALGPCLFGQGYAPLAPKREQGERSALEVVVQSATDRCKTSKPQHHIADRVCALLEKDNVTIPDRHSGAPRPLEPRDIAILCLTGSSCIAHADALRELGLPVRLSEGGWWGSAVVQAACFSLRHVADPGDRHAALCLATLGPPALALDEALRRMAAGEELMQPEVAALHEAAAGWSVEQVLANAIRVAGLRDWCDRLPDPAQARADLLRLEAEARDFDQADRAMRAAAGYHGDGVQVFLGWLEGRVALADDARPAPSGAAADGVEVVTWHSAKGREWPVVIVATLDHNRDPRCGEYQLAMADFADFDDVLQQAMLTAAPDFAAPEATARCLAPRWADAGEDCRRLLYVALTRARDRLVIEWPKPKKDKAKKARDEEDATLPVTPAAILMRECGLMLGDNWLELGGTRFPARVIQCPADMPPAFGEGRATAGDGARAPRFALVTGQALGLDGVLERVIGPSAATEAALALPPVLETVALAPGLRLRSAGMTRATERGTAVHEAFRILLQRPDLADRVAARCRVDEGELAALAAQAEALRAELARRGFGTMHVEQPLDIPLPDGTRQTVILDLLVEGAGGWLVVDYKSGAVPDHAGRYAEYWPQLSAYVAAVNVVAGGRVAGAAILWTDSGELTVGLTDEEGAK